MTVFVCVCDRRENLPKPVISQRWQIENERNTESVLDQDCRRNTVEHKQQSNCVYPNWAHRCLTAMQDCCLGHRALEKYIFIRRLFSLCKIPLFVFHSCNDFGNRSHAWHLSSLFCWMKLWSYFLLSALHIGWTNTVEHKTHTQRLTCEWRHLHGTTPTHFHTDTHICSQTKAWDRLCDFRLTAKLFKERKWNNHRLQTTEDKEITLQVLLSIHWTSLELNCCQEHKEVMLHEKVHWNYQQF